MPYSIPAPAPAPLPIHVQGRPGHRRSYTTEAIGTGAFSSLGMNLPRRTHRTVFHLRHEDDEDDDSYDSSYDDDDESESEEERKRSSVSASESRPAARSRQKNNSLRIPMPPANTPATTTNDAVPFPRASPLLPQSEIPPPALAQKPTSPRPSVPRTSSTPVILSNGKPLKSSLKSSSSSPAIASPAASEASKSPLSLTAHARTQSAPTSPLPAKNVHFPSKQDHLASVRIFDRSAKPAAVSRVRAVTHTGAIVGDDTETETETDRDTIGYPYAQRRSAWGYPFPRFPVSPIRASAAKTMIPGSAAASATPAPSPPSWRYKLDKDTCSPVPAFSPHPHANVHLEALHLVSPSDKSKEQQQEQQQPLSLRGTLLVRNLAYEKIVAVRFTLDEWDTTSEVSARYRESLSRLPEGVFIAGSGLIDTGDEGENEREAKSTPMEGKRRRGKKGDAVVQPGTGDAAHPAWDRFDFTIKLEDYALSLEKKTLWLVVRYMTPVGSAPRPLLLGDEPTRLRVPSPPSSSAVDGARAVMQSGGGKLRGDGVQGPEYWDNNSGRNYKIGFKKVRGQVQRDASTSSATAITTTTTGPKAPSIPALGTDAPSQIRPTVMSTPSGHAAATATLLARLKKLNLKNYAAPSYAAAAAAPPASAPKRPFGYGYDTGYGYGSTSVGGYPLLAHDGAGRERGAVSAPVSPINENGRGHGSSGEEFPFRGLFRAGAEPERATGEGRTGQDVTGVVAKPATSTATAPIPFTSQRSFRTDETHDAASEGLDVPASTKATTPASAMGQAGTAATAAGPTPSPPALTTATTVAPGPSPKMGSLDMGLTFLASTSPPGASFLASSPPASSVGLHAVASDGSSADPSSSGAVLPAAGVPATPGGTAFGLYWPWGGARGGARHEAPAGEPREPDEDGTPVGRRKDEVVAGSLEGSCSSSSSSSCSGSGSGSPSSGESSPGSSRTSSVESVAEMARARLGRNDQTQTQGTGEKTEEVNVPTPTLTPTLTPQTPTHPLPVRGRVELGNAPLTPPEESSSPAPATSATTATTTIATPRTATTTVNAASRVGTRVFPASPPRQGASAWMMRRPGIGERAWSAADVTSSFSTSANAKADTGNKALVVRDDMALPDSSSSAAVSGPLVSTTHVSSAPSAPPSTTTTTAAATATTTAPASGETDRAALYEAFVRRWCFAQTPPPSTASGSGGANLSGPSSAASMSSAAAAQAVSVSPRLTILGG